jgi:hypothetical protein
MIGRFCRNYLQRHQNRTNQILHLVGVPLTFGVSTACLVNSNWTAAAACFLGGYALQFLGHAIEGNDAGEVILIKKMLNKPYIEFAPGSDYSNFKD